MGSYRTYTFRVREEEATKNELEHIDLSLKILKDMGCLK